MSEQISVAQIEKRLELLRKWYGVDVGYEKMYGYYKFTNESTSRNYCAGSTKVQIYEQLCAFEEGYQQAIKQVKSLSRVADLVKRNRPQDPEDPRKEEFEKFLKILDAVY